jgi:hypothetical protein
MAGYPTASAIETGRKSLPAWSEGSTVLGAATLRVMPQ